MTHPKPMGELVRSMMPKLAELTDDDWARRDAEVQATLESEDTRRREEQQRRLVAALVEVGLSDLHVEIALGEPLETPGVVTVRGMTGRGIWVLAGGVGCGKTTAVHTWLLPKTGRIEPQTVAFVSSHEFARTSRYEGKIERLTEPDRLAIDDLGVEYLDSKGSALVDYDELLDTRVRTGRGTLLTTNLSPEAFRSRYGARIVDRVREHGGWHTVDGPSLRGRRP